MLDEFLPECRRHARGMILSVTGVTTTLWALRTRQPLCRLCVVVDGVCVVACCVMTWTT